MLFAILSLLLAKTPIEGGAGIPHRRSLATATTRWRTIVVIRR